MKKERRICLVLLLIFLSSSLSAMPWNISSGIFVHESSVFGTKVEGAVWSNLDDFEFGAMFSDYTGAMDFSWNYKSEKTLRATVGTSLNGYFKEGGLWTVYGDIGQDFRFWGRMALKYRAGLQMGLSWSDYAPLSVPFSLSPYAYWAIGYDDDTFKVLLYGDSNRIFEHTFQAPPVLGVELGWNIDEHNSVGIDSYMKLADYMEGPDLMITDFSLRMFYTYRGGEV